MFSKEEHEKRIKAILKRRRQEYNRKFKKIQDIISKPAQFNPSFLGRGKAIEFESLEIARRYKEMARIED